jgi:TrmH family RNA methyltransferase
MKGSAENGEGLILLGNEGQGIGQSLLPFIDQAVTIPRFGSAESLNVAIAAALICSEIRRHDPK